MRGMPQDRSRLLQPGQSTNASYIFLFFQHYREGGDISSESGSPHQPPCGCAKTIPRR